MYVAFWLQATVGILLLGAGAAKLRHPGQFRAAVKGYYVARRLQGIDLAAIAVVPAGEIFSGWVLATRMLPAWIGAAVAFPLLVVFTVAVYINMRHGLRTACGCGLGRSATGSPLVFRNVLAMAVLGAGLLLAPSARLVGAASTVVVLYLLSALMAVALLYLPALGEEFRHQLGHVR